MRGMTVNYAPDQCAMVNQFKAENRVRLHQTSIVVLPNSVIHKGAGKPSFYWSVAVCEREVFYCGMYSW